MHAGVPESNSNMSRPFVSVVVLNYNGLRFLDGCLSSLARLDYPRERYEVVLLDNDSADGSSEVAEKRFPWARVVRNGRNLGFAGGNNVALRSPRADYVVLLNNDTSVHERWLSELVEAAERDPSIGMCTSKLLFTLDRARLRLEVCAFRPADAGSTDQRELGVRVLGSSVLQGDDSREIEYLEGFYGQEPSPEGPFRWSAPTATIGLRVDRAGEQASLRLSVAAPRPDGQPVPAALFWGQEQLGRWEIDGRPGSIEVLLPEQLIASATPVIQNSGTLILHNGSGRDRGTVVRGTEAYSEDDLGQYERPEEVFAGCGAALLIRREMLRDIGPFDEDFFMYYEDMDLSWRARRRGWKVLYVPKAVVRHIHCGSSVEWSPLFLFHVERNRLLMLAKNAPLALAAREHLRYAAEAALNLGRYARAFARRSPDSGAVGRRARIQLRVLSSLARLMAGTVAKRRQLKRSERVPASKLLDWMVTG
jgi:O-antigen biosynthesis protein